jgi:hypothetical protein
VSERLNVDLYWRDPPPEASAGLVKWLAKVRKGWRPNRRLGGMDYYSCAEYYRIYIWEWFNVLKPALEEETP